MKKQTIKPSKDVKKAILVIPIVAIIFYLVMFSLIYVFYMMRSEQSFKNIKEETQYSSILNSTFGEIIDIKYDNFMTWISKKNGYECVKFKIYTKDNNYKVCSIIEGEHAIGFIINDRIYTEGK